MLILKSKGRQQDQLLVKQRRLLEVRPHGLTDFDCCSCAAYLSKVRRLHRLEHSPSSLVPKATSIYTVFKISLYSFLVVSPDLATKIKILDQDTSLMCKTSYNPDFSQLHTYFQIKAFLHLKRTASEAASAGSLMQQYHRSFH